MEGKEENVTRGQKKAELRKMRAEASSPVLDLQTRRISSEKELQIQARNRKRNRHLPVRIFSGILLVLVLGGLVVYTFHPLFRVRKVNIYGMDGLSHDELIYYLGAKDTPIYQLSPGYMESVLTARYEDVESASVRIGVPSRVDVYLEERVGIIEWDFGGSSFWVDKSGLVLLESRSLPETIHIYADSYPGSLSKEDRNLPKSLSADTVHTILSMAEAVPKGKNLYYTYDNGYGWDSDQGYRLFFGKSDADLEEKLRMAESLQKYFAEEEIEPVFLSVEFKDAPYYRFSE